MYIKGKKWILRPKKKMVRQKWISRLKKNGKEKMNIKVKTS